MKVGTITSFPMDRALRTPGLENLMPLDQLLIEQESDQMENAIGIELPNKYRILSSTGHLLYSAAEKYVHPGGTLRPFDIRISMANSEILRVTRPFRCDCCLIPCWLQKVTIKLHPNNILGYVIQKWSPMGSKFFITNSYEDPMLKIIGPCCTSFCGKNADFKILSLKTNEEIGVIQKQWSGFAQELLTDADNFTVTFPRELDVQLKAVLLGACFLIDFIYFESVPTQQRQRRR